MSYEFTGVSNQALAGQFIASLPPNPLTMFCWAKVPATSSSNLNIVTLGESTAANSSSVNLMQRPLADNYRLQTTSVTGGVSGIARTAESAIIDRWVPIMNKFVANNSRVLYVDDVTLSTVQTTEPTLNPFGFVSVGTNAVRSSFGAFTGKVGHVAVWDIALDDFDIESLMSGVAPSEIQPANLLGYWPLTADLPVQPNEGTDTSADLTVGSAATFSPDNPPVSVTSGVTGGLAATEARDTFAASGAKVYAATLAATEAFDTFAASGQNQQVRTGTLATTEGKDAFQATGDVFTQGISGGLAATEARDTFSADGAKAYAAALAATEARDVAAFAGQNQRVYTGTLATTEGKDAFAADGDVFTDGTVGGIAATEARDVFAGAGAKVYAAYIQAVEQGDVAAFNGAVAKIINGTLAATEMKDSAAFTNVVEKEVGNTILPRDANFGIGISPETVWKDGSPSWGRPGSDVDTEFPTAIGLPQSTENFANQETQRQMRLIQAISDTPAGSDVIPGWASYVAAKTGEWVWCLSRTQIVADKDNPIGQGDVAAV